MKFDSTIIPTIASNEEFEEAEEVLSKVQLCENNSNEKNSKESYHAAILTEPEFDRRRAKFYEKTAEKNFKEDSDKKGFVQAKKSMRFFQNYKPEPLETEPKYTLNFNAKFTSQIVTPPSQMVALKSHILTSNKDQQQCSRAITETQPQTYDLENDQG